MYPHQHPLDTASDVIVELQRTFYEDVGGGETHSWEIPLHFISRISEIDIKFSFG